MNEIDEMTDTTEVFVLVIYVLGFPLFVLGFRAARLPGKNLFIAAYACLLFSNIFTVAEAYWQERIMNALEHGSILLSAIFVFLAVMRIAPGPDKRNSGTG